MWVDADKGIDRYLGDKIQIQDGGRRGTMMVQVGLKRGGDYDFVLIVTAKDMTAYDRLTRRIFFNTTNIQKIHTTVALENISVWFLFFVLLGKQAIIQEHLARITSLIHLLKRATNCVT
ncbi:MAG: Lrp/AsnC ligand binding domain-containing protein [Magnetovibrio sp.]|nr:Lrp/AsnC ligand binding domain-containing protein [Magnetovibrio sp.]